MEKEPNEDPQRASTLRDVMASPNAFIGATLTPNDIDYFSVAVPDGMSIRAEIIEMKPNSLGPSCKNGMYAKLTLHDASGPRISVSNGGRGNCPLIDGTGTGAAAGAHELPGGTYYLAVQSMATNAFDYNLVVTVR